MDSEFGPYIQVTMPGLLATDADVSVYGKYFCVLLAYLLYIDRRLLIDASEEKRGEGDGWHIAMVRSWKYVRQGLKTGTMHLRC
jgi:hypothetical protein